MAESTLALSYDEYRQHLSHYLGYGGSVSGMSPEEAETVEMLLCQALRTFYFQALLPGGKAVHRWSFLENCEATITTVVDTDSYDLPDNFGGLARSVVIDESGDHEITLKQVNESQIRKMRSHDGETVDTDRPRYFCIRPVPDTPTATEGQRFEMWVYPVPDEVLTISYAYRVNADKITTAAPYPLGGTQHSQTILKACYAEAEQYMLGQPGQMQMQYYAALATSITHDADFMRSSNLGRMEGRRHRRISHRGSRFGRTYYPPYFH